MKAILEFNLPDDQIDFQDANNGQKFRLMLWEFDQYLRSQTKYAPDSMSDDTYKAYAHIREKLHEMLIEDNLSLD